MKHPKIFFDLVTTEPEFKPKRVHSNGPSDGMCAQCAKQDECRERVKINWPLLCELWDEQDVFICQFDPRERAVETGRFKKGHVPWNKGMVGLHSSPETEFKVGGPPANTLPVGTEVVRRGYMFRKVAEPNVWKQRSHILWEEHHGRSLPDGYILRRRDGDKLNDDLDNLVAIPRSQNIVETLKDPDIRERRREATARALKKRWGEYQHLNIQCTDCGRKIDKPGLCGPCATIRKYRLEMEVGGLQDTSG